MELPTKTTTTELSVKRLWNHVDLTFDMMEIQRLEAQVLF